MTPTTGILREAWLPDRRNSEKTSKYTNKFLLIIPQIQAPIVFSQHTKLPWFG